MRLLIDTNVYVAFARGHGAVAELFRDAQAVLLSTVVAGELLYGFRHGSKYTRNKRAFDTFVENPYVEVVPVTLTTADRFSRLASALRKKGTPIPTNDLWLAAHAAETGAELISFDRHFAHVDGIAWACPGDTL